ncbi:MAG: site-2 protease family protein [Corallococcus sp.]|nr:site-2 protease family protein [Corallococcus sp.]MCM1359692.1 site-2 protease family protein [Corallococcus sp.]MCM1395401.1 site-2 protease family protein [Corallococcus sp.]
MYVYDLLTNFGDGVCREGLLNVLAFIFALVFALVLHELAHGLVALWNGDGTAKAMGRLSINPVKHFDIVGFLMLLLVGFGWARPVPVNPNNFKHKRWGAFTVSLAGVFTNLLLAFVFALPFVAIGGMTFADKNSAYYAMYCLYMFCQFMVVLNVSFALFNLLPLFPLDGYRLIASLSGENNAFMRFLRRYSLYIMLFLLVWDTVCSYVPALSSFSPLDWYVRWIGGKIQLGFIKFWGLIL